MKNRKWKLALAALLGFSAACSTVRQAAQEKRGTQEPQEPQPVDTTLVREGQTPPRIVLMYGVRPPLSDSVRTKRLEQQRPDSLPPVAETPSEEDPSAR